jgi:hypothetical protein
MKRLIKLNPLRGGFTNIDDFRSRIFVNPPKPEGGFALLILFGTRNASFFKVALGLNRSGD